MIEILNKIALLATVFFVSGCSSNCLKTKNYELIKKHIIENGEKYTDVYTFYALDIKGYHLYHKENQNSFRINDKDGEFKAYNEKGEIFVKPISKLYSPSKFENDKSAKIRWEIKIEQRKKDFCTILYFIKKGKKP